MASSDKNCCVLGCEKPRTDNLTLHSFPNPEKDRERYKAWIDAVGNNISSMNPKYVYQYRKVCHDHFETKYKTWTRRLSFNAVPTLLLPLPSDSQLLWLSEGQLNKKRVCEKHFDRYQFDVEGKRLRFSYPSLFTDKEIAHGVPLCSSDIIPNDHNYFREKADKDENLSDDLLVIQRAGEDFHEHPEDPNRYIIPLITESHSGSKDVLHKFPNPAKDNYRFITWLYSVGGNILSLSHDHIFKFRRVCRRHFEEKYWCRNNFLSNIAVPTLNMPGPSTSVFHRSDHNYCSEPDKVHIIRKGTCTGTLQPQDPNKKRCSVRNCNNEEYPGSLISFHGFPEDKTLQFKWKIAIPNSVDSSSIVCSAHFKHDDFLTTQTVPGAVKTLKPEAIPSVFTVCMNDFPKLPEQVLNPTAEEPEAVVVEDNIQAVPDEGIPDTRDDDSELFDDDDLMVHDEVISDSEDVVVPARSRDIQDEHHYDPKVHDGFSCNVCSGAIVGFRYCCVQCPDWDMCGTCESSGAHAAHYVLRVPAPRAFAEIQSVLEQIRKALALRANDPLYSDAALPPDATLDADEIKSEDEDWYDVPMASTTDNFVSCDRRSDAEDIDNDFDATEVHNENIENLNESVETLNNGVENHNDSIGNLTNIIQIHNDSIVNLNYSNQIQDVSLENYYYIAEVNNEGDKDNDNIIYLGEDVENLFGTLEEGEIAAVIDPELTMVSSVQAGPHSPPLYIDKDHMLVTDAIRQPLVPPKNRPRILRKEPVKNAPAVAKCISDDRVRRKIPASSLHMQPRVVLERLEVPKGVFKIKIRKISNSESKKNLTPILC